MQSSPTEIFINGTSFAGYNRALCHDGYVDLSHISAETFSARLGIALNTFFQLMTFPNSFLGNRERDLSAYGPEATPIDLIREWFGANATLPNLVNRIYNSRNNSELALSGEHIALLTDAPFVGASSTGTATRVHQIYACNFIWLACLFASSISLLTVGVVGIALKWRLLAPDMLGLRREHDVRESLRPGVRRSRRVGCHGAGERDEGCADSDRRRGGGGKGWACGVYVKAGDKEIGEGENLSLMTEC